MSVDFVGLRLAAVDGFHVKGVAQDEWDILLRTKGDKSNY
jgi:hypothetical protein